MAVRDEFRLLEETTFIGGESAAYAYVTEPVDIVYTWVNGSDPQHQALVDRLKKEKGLYVNLSQYPCVEPFEGPKQSAGVFQAPLTSGSAPSSSLSSLSNQTSESNETSSTSGSSNATNKTSSSSSSPAQTNGTSKDWENDPFRFTTGGNRFIDNEELRYSLRSVEMYAPWVRHIWIVTNGQVPAWLNLSNPHVSIVTHADIFRNASHLPSFSSPAIEANLHRIPGLASRFVYLNDDVMFAKPVFPDDFVTLGGGQKIFLSWGIPPCAEGCQGAWLGDGYCDAACNVSQCAYDNGDCLGPHTRSRYDPFPRSTAQSTACALGCMDAWLGDKYCDRTCNVPECGYDLTDCDLAPLFSDPLVHGLRAADNAAFVLPAGTFFVYFNLSTLEPNLPEFSVVDGDFNDTAAVRRAIVKSSQKVLAVLLFRNVTNTTVQLTLTLAISDGTRFNKTFSLFVTDTFPVNSSSSESEEASSPVSSSESDSVQNSSDSNSESNSSESNTSSNSSGPKCFKLPPRVDTFAESLKFVDRMYTRDFGYELRKVIAHMPHFIDVRLMKELQERYKSEFDATSAHQFRDAHDMQYAFSYMYYLADARVPFNATELWYELFDRNRDDVLSPFEMRTLALVLRGLPFGGDEERQEEEQNITATCTNGTLPLHRAQFERCDGLLARLNRTATVQTRSRYLHEFRGDDDVWFVSLTNNANQAALDLDQIILHPRKWICLNDDMDHADPASQRVVRIIHDFYAHQYPRPSQFEYRDGTVNPLLHVSEIVVSQQRARTAAANRLVAFCAAQLLLLLAFAMLAKARRLLRCCPQRAPLPPEAHPHL